MNSLFKKICFSVLAVVGVLSLSQVFAAEENNALNALQGDNPGWASSITTSGPTSNSVNIEFPIYTANGEQIMNYSVTYVKDKAIASADTADLKNMGFEGDKIKLANGKITLVLDGLVASSTYNFVVSAINKEGTELELSDEVSFQTLAEGASNNQGGGSILNDGNGGLQGSADTASANFTYVLDSNKVTVSWKAISGASKFSISTKEATQSTYTYVGEVDISKESYTFVIGKVGLHTVRIVPIDNAGNNVGVERTLAIKIDAISTPTGTGTPATGVGLNLILMSTFLMMLIYVVYRFRTTK